VLKDTGTCWINLGDTYSTVSGGFKDIKQGKVAESKQYRKNEEKHEKLAIDQSKLYTGLQAKSRIGIPERFYINCIDDGWIARNHIFWYKANAMPSSVKDRFTNKWESVFFFVKNQSYYFDLDAVREDTISETKPFNVRVRDSSKNKFLQKALTHEVESHNEKGEKKQDSTLGPDGKPIPTYSGFNDRWKNRKHVEEGFNNTNVQTMAKNHSGNYNAETGECLNNPKGKNPGDGFFINPRPFPEAHFATFPVDLPEKIIKCGCPEGGLVLDPFFGSGTVGEAAEKLNRRWVGIEINQEYIDIANRRLDKFKNKSMGDFI